MKDLFSLLKKASHIFSKVEEDYKNQFKKIKKIKSPEDLLKINDSEDLVERIAELNPKSTIDKAVLERIIGKNNLMDISYFQKGLDVAKTVCRIIEFNGGQKQPYGTGFLVGERLMMTNNHVIESQSAANRLLAEFEYEKNTDGLVKSTSIFKINPEEFFMTSPNLDYTVVALEPIAKNNPEKKLEDYGYNKLSSSVDKIYNGGAVSIIQHPEGFPKMIAIRENVVVNVNEPFIHYTTDTQQGSSGSLVANDNWEIIALHRSGVPEKNDKGEIKLTKGGIWRNRADTPFINWIANQGVLIDNILEDMNSKKVTKEQEYFKEQILKNFILEQNEVEYRLPNRRHK